MLLYEASKRGDVALNLHFALYWLKSSTQLMQLEVVGLVFLGKCNETKLQELGEEFLICHLGLGNVLKLLVILDLLLLVTNTETGSKRS